MELYSLQNFQTGIEDPAEGTHSWDRQMERQSMRTESSKGRDILLHRSSALRGFSPDLPTIAWWRLGVTVGGGPT